MSIGRYSLWFGVLLALLAVACGGRPKHAEMRMEHASAVVFEGGDQGSVVLLDGVEIGRISGKRTTILVKDGTYRLEIKSGGVTVHESTLFIQDGTRKTISLK